MLDSHDRRILEEAVERTIDAIELAVREGYDVAMNHLNAGSRKPAAPPERDAE